MVEGVEMSDRVRPCRSHPPHRREVTWDRDEAKGLSWVIAAKCGRCGAELNVSRADGAYVSGPRKAGQTGPAVSGRPLDAHGNEL